MARNKLFWGIVILGIFFLSFSTASARVIETIFSEDWEFGPNDWDVSHGVWQIGTPTAGPGVPHGGEQCAGTVLDDNYPNYTDIRLISPSIRLPEVSGDEEIHLRFWHWFSFAYGDAGYVQISVYDEVTAEWSAWDNINDAIARYSVWSRKAVDITAYAGQKVRIAFYHTADSYSASTGWYVDDIAVIRSVAISEHSFAYIITATGTENKVVYPGRSFTWTVSGAGTETWYTFPYLKFTWTVTGTGTETWYEQMPDEGDPAIYGFYQSGSAWYKDEKQVTQYGVSEFRVIGEKPFWKYGGRYYYNNMVGSSTLPNRWGHMGKVTQSGATCFCVVGGKAFWKYGGIYYRNNLIGYDCLGWPCAVGWDGTWGHMGKVTQPGVSEFVIHDAKPYWKLFSKCYYNTLVSYDCPGYPCRAGWDGTWSLIKETSCPLPSSGSINPCAFGSHTATRTATDSGSSAVTKTDGKKFISTFSAMPQPQQGGTISGITYSITDNNANVNTWISGNSVYASTAYSETHTATRTATDSGSGMVNKPEGDKDMGTFSAYPQPEQGGTISGVTYSISDNNPEVDTWISGDHVYARTDYSEIQTVPWSDTEAGSGSVNDSEGDKYITTSTLVAPNDDTVWSVSDDSDYVETWMVGNELYARVATIFKGDFDNDGDVDESDLAIFAADFGRTGCLNHSMIYTAPNVAPYFNLALNTGGTYPHAYDSSPGWGGGNRPWDLVDGMRSYPWWNYGLATAWTSSGWYQATINFGEPMTFDTIVPWWHGYSDYAPKVLKVQIWDGASWVDVFSTTNTFDHFVMHSDPNIDPILTHGSSATEFRFDPVTALKVRVTWDQEEIWNRSGMHAWLYSLEVYYVASCEGDFDGDGDGDVDGLDLAVFAEEFGRTDCP